jgi:hypothetical protein
VLDRGLTTNKRIKHIEAISLLARHLGFTIFEFLFKERREVADILYPPHTGYWLSYTRPVSKMLYR